MLIINLFFEIKSDELCFIKFKLFRILNSLNKIGQFILKSKSYSTFFKRLQFS